MELVGHEQSSFIDTIRNATADEIYDWMHACQRKIAAYSFREYLMNLPAWATAKTVLDVGCGNAAFVREHCHTLFANKRYHGIDIDESLIFQAKVKFRERHFTFQRADIYEYFSPGFDAAFLFATLQCLPDVSRALDRLAASKSIVIFDKASGTDYGFKADPQIPSLHKHYEFLRARGAAADRNRDRLREAAAWARRNGWHIPVDGNFEIRVDRPFERQVLVQFSLLFEAMLEKRCGVPADYERLNEELQRWRSAEDSYLTTTGAGRWLVCTRDS
jgi:SAM-dependent methyltransferase